MPRGRPRKNLIPDTPIECVNLKPVENSVETVENAEDNNSTPSENPTETVAVNSTPTKKKNSPDLNSICMACGKIIPDTPRKLELASCFDVAPYRFNTALNEKGRIILCPKCSNKLVEFVDLKLKEMGCKQKYDCADIDYTPENVRQWL